VVAEEADGLQDDRFMSFGGEGFQGVFDGGADPGSSGDALGLKGKVPVAFFEADGGEHGSDFGSGLFALNGIGVGSGGGAVVLDAVGWRWAVGCALLTLHENGAAGNGVCGEEYGNVDLFARVLAGLGASFGPDGPELLREGFGEERFGGPAGDEVVGEGRACVG